MRIFFGHTSDGSFVLRDLAILKSRHDVCARNLEHRDPLRLLRDMCSVTRCRVAFFWFASIRALPCMLVAKVLGKRIAVVVGGYEAACVPDINYGQARFAVRRLLTRIMLRAADLVLAVSESSRRDILNNLRIDDDRVTLLYHGFEDLAGDFKCNRKPIVINIGDVNERTWRTKGIADFIEVAEEMPQTRFVQIGDMRIDCEKKLGRPLPANLSMIGKVPYERLSDYLADAKVYLQLSRRESFGCSVAEAMLFGCIPIVTNVFALPEVVGDCGITVESHRKEEIKEAIGRAMAFAIEEGERCRSRILTQFSYEQRAARLLDLIDNLRT